MLMFYVFAHKTQLTELEDTISPAIVANVMGSWEKITNTETVGF